MLPSHKMCIPRRTSLRLFTDQLFHNGVPLSLNNTLRVPLRQLSQLLGGEIGLWPWLRSVTLAFLLSSSIPMSSVKAFGRLLNTVLKDLGAHDRSHRDPMRNLRDLQRTVQVRRVLLVLLLRVRDPCGAGCRRLPRLIMLLPARITHRRHNLHHSHLRLSSRLLCISSNNRNSLTASRIPIMVLMLAVCLHPHLPRRLVLEVPPSRPKIKALCLLTDALPVHH